MSGAAPFIGVNLPWLGDAYGHDLGHNRAHPGWPAQFDPWRVERLFELLQSRGIALLRFWLFEDGEGLLYDEHDQVIGLDRVFCENLHHFIGLARRWRMRVFWTLLDANSLRRRNDMVTRHILATTEGAAAFIANALLPVLYDIAQVAWAIDLCNEPEAMVSGHLGNGSGLGFDWWDLMPQLAMLAQAIREHCGELPVTVGSGFHEHHCLAAGRYTGLGLDALSYHAHAHEGPIAPAHELSRDLPVIIGELGWPLPGHWAHEPSSWERAQQRLSGRMKLAVEAGYAAIFLWLLSDAEGNAESLVWDGNVGRPLELVRPFQASGTLAVPETVSILPSHRVRSGAQDLGRRAGCNR